MLIHLWLVQVVNILNLGTCCVIANLHAGINFVDKNLDDVLPKFRQRARILHFAKDFAKNI